MPTTLDETGWLGSVVRAAVSGGRELDRAPRFLLAQDRTHRIVGVACQAAALDPAMSSDGDRALYCFVGWATPRDGRLGPAVPSFQELSRDYVAWAGPVYTEILGKVWTVSATAYCPPERTEPGAAPWPPAGQDLGTAPPPAEGLWPEQTWPALWTAAQTASMPLTCVIGWRDTSSARAEGATHVGAADAPARPLPALPQVTPQVTPLPMPPAKAEPLPGSAPATKPPERRPIAVALGVAAVIGAAVGAAITALATGGSAAPPAQPVRIQLVVPASAQPAPGTLLRYLAGALSAGQATARLAMWPGASAPSATACANTLRATQAATPIPAEQGERVCVQLTGQPARYGVIEVTTMSPSSVTAQATIWP
ncbi:MAG TPA: hypothetical protein VFB06_24145 [Streptosporangiaceae bacterium]|nr:hypothetical protein [Streptosporangiaceae bacterium]